METFKRGTRVKFRKALDPGDEKIRMVVLEDNGNRVFVQDDISTMPLKPTHTILKSEIELAID
jgi:hypothetical protein